MASRLHDSPFLHLLPGSLSGDATIRAAAASLDKVLQTTALAVPNLLLFARLGGQSEASLLPPLARLARAGDGLKELSLAELEQLAWQFHVDFREVATTPEQLAAMVRASIPWHRIKGTPESIRRALGLFGYGTVRFLPSAASTCALSSSHGREESTPVGQGLVSLPTKELAPFPGIEREGITIEEGEKGKHWATYQLGLPQIATLDEVRHIVRIAGEMAPVRCRLWRIYTGAFDRRPIVVGNGPKLGDGWLTFYSGVSVETPGGEGGEGGDVIVSFGTRNAFQAEVYAPHPLCASFGSVIHLGFLAPYLDRFMVGRSALSAVYPRNHGFAMGSLFSILWADRATTGRRWRGEWDARRWLDYTGFDRKLPPWRMGRRQLSRSQLVPGWGEAVSHHNARLGATFATVINNPARISAARLSDHDPERRLLRLHELFIEEQPLTIPSVAPGIPCTAGQALFSVATPGQSPERVYTARHSLRSVGFVPREQAPLETALAQLQPLATPTLAPDPAPPSALTHWLGPLWQDRWDTPGRTWTTESRLTVQ